MYSKAQAQVMFNTFYAKNPNRIALYHKTVIINHSCFPNSTMSRSTEATETKDEMANSSDNNNSIGLQENMSVRIFAIEEIEPNEEICISYKSLHLPTKR